jgi:hypothetical protein
MTAEKPTDSSSSTRRDFLAASAAVSAVALLPSALHAAKAADNIRPFRVDVPDAALADLRQRVAATRFPDKETVADHTQGVPLATVQKLAQYWQTGYEWRKVEARLNAGRHILVAVVRYLAAHSPTERSTFQTADIAQRLMRGGQLHEAAESSA